MTKAIRTNLTILFALAAFQLNAQKATSIDLKDNFSKNKLVINKTLKPLDDGDKHGVTGKGIVWIKEMQFSTGVIEIDLRGKDAFQQSFLGIAFHGLDTVTYDAVYFRPFNFRSADSVRKIHAVQYVSSPDYHWDRLRKEFNGVYEKGINPPPEADKWFHARIEVGESEIKVFVNKAAVPSLVVNKLNNRNTGLIGLWSTNSGVDGDFANLTISKR